MALQLPSVVNVILRRDSRHTGQDESAILGTNITIDIAIFVSGQVRNYSGSFVPVEYTCDMTNNTFYLASTTLASQIYCARVCDLKNIAARDTPYIATACSNLAVRRSSDILHDWRGAGRRPNGSTQMSLNCSTLGAIIRLLSVSSMVKKARKIKRPRIILSCLERDWSPDTVLCPSAVGAFHT
ncbi:hypothetical protein FVE85_3652 [Porphyridium purpureum]|uniref:Uncharacterized protein n=1 Tax=Porphyridium purpureum TaxID=35688 RepID=A0A5J4YNG2_PORPP|nr:hypothetical protein FVE85_3652 [Porphyridium purpureum]|eukprot:POR0145..scf249_10